MKILYRIISCALFLVAIAITVRVFILDQFKVCGDSMNPTLVDGDKILVNKVILGARLYKNFDFSRPELECVRIPGIRDIRSGDIVVFNNPRGWGNKKIEFQINNVFLKRCIGCPGDTVSIVDGYYYKNHTHCDVIPNDFQNVLCDTPDSILAERGVVLESFPHMKSLEWTIRDFGPIVVPKKGSVVQLTAVTARLYSLPIEYEVGEKPKVVNGSVYISNQRVVEYCFKKNWVFLGGDNVLDSKDSRYLGLIPEEFLIGVATRKLYRVSNLSNKISFSTFMDPII